MENKQIIKKLLIIFFIIAALIAAALLIAPYLTFGKPYQNITICYADYEFEDLLTQSDNVFYCKLIGVEPARIPPDGSTDQITTDIVMAVLDENGQAVDTIILRESGGRVGARVLKNNDSITKSLRTGKEYIICVSKSKSLAESVIYFNGCEGMVFNECYRLMSGPVTVFEVENSNNKTASGVLGRAVASIHNPAHYGEKTFGDFAEFISYSVNS